MLRESGQDMTDIEPHMKSLALQENFTLLKDVLVIYGAFQRIVL